ncbi:MAG: tRNA pseudouridine(55) synthase TruB [Armatimonadetes bacterium CG07_land_8_20_14_0_80_40_9]|nr:MAG: tRNA pseudouridine(55) synthase TruB [Armatimonadetes bacterium CG07_land_8_20_14_0_80_40_9]
MNGILNINKPKGLTSFAVVSFIRRLLSIKKVGHSGTLDPSASGVLIICLGQATKIVEYLLEDDKEYLAEITLGISTNTYDAEGEVIKREEVKGKTQEDVETVLKRFLGEIEQVPPMVSALHFQGKRLYKLARQGKEVKRPPRKVKIYSLKLIDFKASKFPKFTLKVTCSRGTYIRALATDIGKALSLPAHLSNLKRVRCGPFHLKSALTLEKLEDIKSNNQLKETILPLDVALKHLPEIKVSNQGARKILQGGNPRDKEMVKVSPQLKKGDKARVYNEEGNLLAIGGFYPNLVKPLKVFTNT